MTDEHKTMLQKLANAPAIKKPALSLEEGEEVTIMAPGVQRVGVVVLPENRPPREITYKVWTINPSKGEGQNGTEEDVGMLIVMKDKSLTFADKAFLGAIHCAIDRRTKCVKANQSKLCEKFAMWPSQVSESIRKAMGRYLLPHPTEDDEIVVNPDIAFYGDEDLAKALWQRAWTAYYKLAPATAEPVKCGRGRPRKHPKPDVGQPMVTLAKTE